METVLMFAETIFFFTMSVAVLIVSTLCVIFMIHVVHIAKKLKEFSDGLSHASHKVGERVYGAIDRILDLPILSYFLKKYSRAHEKKGSTKLSKNK